MARICAITGKRPTKGSIIHRKGQSKKSGGIGTHITTITKRKFRPNLQKIRIRTANGGTKRVLVSVRPSRPASSKRSKRSGIFLPLKKPPHHRGGFFVCSRDDGEAD